MCLWTLACSKDRAEDSGVLTATDGSSVVSQDTKDEDGIVATKTGYDADGREQWTLEEVLTPLTKEEWLALKASVD